MTTTATKKAQIWDCISFFWGCMTLLNFLFLIIRIWEGDGQSILTSIIAVMTSLLFWLLSIDRWRKWDNLTEKIRTNSSEVIESTDDWHAQIVANLPDSIRADFEPPKRVGTRSWVVGGPIVPGKRQALTPKGATWISEEEFKRRAAVAKYRNQGDF